MSRKAAILAFAAVAAWFTWQILTVHFNYGGNWTALFCIRPGMPVPEFLKSEKLYIFENSEGYDGQVFHLIAHDPWMRKGSRDAIAGAAFRYQRIFVPAAAWMLALGNDRYVHAAYFAVILGFLFLGVYWTSMFAQRSGLAPAWGLVFAITPAAIASLDRMVSDIALASFAAGFALYARKSDWRVLPILACAALTRETALPIVGGYAFYLATERRWRGAILAAATVLPAAAWFLYVSRGEASEVPGYVNWVPLAGFFDRAIHPFVYPFGGWRNAIAQGFDYAAIAGVGLGLVYAARIALRKEWTELSAAIYACALAVIFLKSRAVWEDAYAFGRVLTPFLLLTMLHEWKRKPPVKPWLTALPLMAIGARLSLNLSDQLFGVARALIK